MALRRIAASSLFSRLGGAIRPASAAPSVARSFNTNAQIKRYDEEDGRDVDVELAAADRSVARRREHDFFPDVFDPFTPTRSLSQVFNLVDQLMENPFLGASLGGMGGGLKRAWDVKEDDESLLMRLDMPGLGKDDVKVTVEQNTLVIKGEAEKESKTEESRRRYSTRIDLSPELYKLGEIKAEMKNGVLRVVVPKAKEEEKKNVFQVQIE